MGNWKTRDERSGMERLEDWSRKWGLLLFMMFLVVWGLLAAAWIVHLREENAQMGVRIQAVNARIAELEEFEKQAIQPVKLKRVFLDEEGKKQVYLEQYRFDADIDSDKWRTSYLVFCRAHPELHVMQVRAEPEWRGEQRPTHVVLTVREKK